VAAFELPASRYVDLDGPVHYVEWEGPPDLTFVLIHGLGGSHLNWVRVAPSLARLGRVVVPDLPGFGRSPLAGRRSAMHVGRRLLGDLVRKLATGQTIVVGNSMGGGYAMLHAAFEPDSVAGLILTSSVFPWAPAAIPSPLAVAAFAVYRMPWVGEHVVATRFRRLDPELVVRWGFRLTAGDPSRIPPEVVRAHVDLVRERQHDHTAAPAFLEAARSILWLGARPSLSRRVIDAIDVPVLVIHGSRDRLVPLAYALSVLERRPTWDHAILPGLGHVPQLEDPDRWLNAVERWLVDRELVEVD
jgi:pimeloyl-ACP methyl ester carboxylesterase